MLKKMSTESKATHLAPAFVYLGANARTALGVVAEVCTEEYACVNELVSVAIFSPLIQILQRWNLIAFYDCIAKPVLQFCSSRSYQTVGPSSCIMPHIYGHIRSSK